MRTVMTIGVYPAKKATLLHKHLNKCGFPTYKTEIPKFLPHNEQKFRVWSLAEGGAEISETHSCARGFIKEKGL